MREEIKKRERERERKNVCAFKSVCMYVCVCNLFSKVHPFHSWYLACKPRIGLEQGVEGKGATSQQLGYVFPVWTQLLAP